MTLDTKDKTLVESVEFGSDRAKTCLDIYGKYMEEDDICPLERAKQAREECWDGLMYMTDCINRIEGLYRVILNLENKIITLEESMSRLDIADRVLENVVGVIRDAYHDTDLGPSELEVLIDRLEGIDLDEASRVNL